MSTSIRDLAFVSVEAVDYHDRTEIPTPSAAGLGFLTDPEIVRYGLGNPYEERPHRLLLRAQFTTGTNLARFTTENSYNLGAYAVFCERPDQEVFLSETGVYWGDHRIDASDGNRILERTGQPITYYFFLGISQPPGAPKGVSYDLRQQAKDVCFYLAGGNGPFGFKSSVVTVGKETIAAALQKVPAGLGGQ